MANETKKSRTLKKLHAAYLAAPGRMDRDDNDPSAPSLRALAKRLGVPFSEADHAATMGHWELERRARRAWAWHKDHGAGAKSEEEFIAAWVKGMYAHLAVEGPEGRALAAAHARDVWRRAMCPALEWEADRELERARKAFEQIQEFRKRRAAA